MVIITHQLRNLLVAPSRQADGVTLPKNDRGYQWLLMRRINNKLFCWHSCVGVCSKRLAIRKLSRPGVSRRVLKLAEKTKPELNHLPKRWPGAIETFLATLPLKQRIRYFACQLAAILGFSCWSRYCIVKKNSKALDMKSTIKNVPLSVR